MESKRIVVDLLKGKLNKSKTTTTTYNQLNLQLDQELLNLIKDELNVKK